KWGSFGGVGLEFAWGRKLEGVATSAQIASSPERSGTPRKAGTRDEGPGYAPAIPHQPPPRTRGGSCYRTCYLTHRHQDIRGAIGSFGRQRNQPSECFLHGGQRTESAIRRFPECSAGSRLRPAAVAHRSGLGGEPIGLGGLALRPELAGVALVRGSQRFPQAGGVRTLPERGPEERDGSTVVRVAQVPKAKTLRVGGVRWRPRRVTPE